jgi:hypothetical protein
MMARGCGGTLRVLEATGSDRDEWMALLHSWQGREIFAHPSYLSLFSRDGERPLCLVYESDRGRVIHPILLRDLRVTPFWGSTKAPVRDALGPPFGYGGPFAETAEQENAEDLLESFFATYATWARDQGVVTEYVVFSPKLVGPIPYPGAIVVKMPTVIRTLHESGDAILRSYDRAVRRRVRGALREGVHVEIDDKGTRVGDFLRVYNDTMLRRKAAGQYFLDQEFLDRLHASLRGYFAYFHAILDGRVVSTELVLLSGDSTFFFRGGTLKDSFTAHPNHLLKHEIILWSKKRGKQYYILGGGNSADDSLYRYKLSFAPQGARPLRIGKWILDAIIYHQLLEAREHSEQTRSHGWRPKEDFFPAYRSP